jgi:ribosomal protein S4
MIVRRRTFKKYMYKARRTRGSFINNYLTFLEGRLFMLVYRSNFVNNIFKLKFIIDRGIFLVDGEKKYYSNHNVMPGQLVQASFDYRDLLKKDFKLRLRKGCIL